VVVLVDQYYPMAKNYDRRTKVSFPVKEDFISVNDFL